MASLKVCSCDKVGHETWCEAYEGKVVERLGWDDVDMIEFAYQLQLIAAFIRKAKERESDVQVEDVFDEFARRILNRLIKTA